MAAKWLCYIAARLKASETRLGNLPPPGDADRDVLAEDTLVEIMACYEELQILEKADTTQVADYVVRSLKRLLSEPTSTATTCSRPEPDSNCRR
jgi:hypothetical protein